MGVLVYRVIMGALGLGWETRDYKVETREYSNLLALRGDVW